MKREDFPLVAASTRLMNLFRLETHNSRIVVNSNSSREAAEIKPFCCNDALLNLYFRLYDCCRSNKTAFILQQPPPQDKRSRGGCESATPFIHPARPLVRPPASPGSTRKNTHRTACTHSCLAPWINKKERDRQTESFAVSRFMLKVKQTFYEAMKKLIWKYPLLIFCYFFIFCY